MADVTIWLKQELGKPDKLYQEHICADEQVICYSLPTVIWQIENHEPLTVSALFSCVGCGIKGWWKEGEWVPLS